MCGISLVMAATWHALGQERAPVKDRAFLEQYAATRRFSLGEPASIRVRPQGDGVLFLRSDGPRSFVQDLWLYDVASGKERVLLTAAQILAGKAELLSVEEEARRQRARMMSRGIVGYQMTKDGTRLLVPLSGRLFLIELTDLATPQTRELKPGPGFPIDPRFSPDGSRVASVREGDLYVLDIASGKEIRLTTGASTHLSFGTAEFVAQEEMHRREGYWFSPDSSMVLYQRTDTSGVETFTISDPANPGAPPQSWPYPRAGRANAEVTLGLVPVGGGDTVWVSWDRAAFPYVARVTWDEHAPLTILVQDRLQMEQQLLRVDPVTGATSVLLRESDPAWINLAGARWLADGSGFLWTTEQDATPPNDRPRLELRAADGSLKATLADGGRNVSAAGFERSAAGERLIMLCADDFRANQIMRVDLVAPGAMEEITPLVPFVHHGVIRRRESDVWVHTRSTPDGLTAIEICRGDSLEPLGRLNSIAERPPWMPRPEFTTVSVGGQDLNAVVIRPREFDKSKKYPVLNSVYGGPGGGVVGASPRGYLLQQWIADQGFIVVSIDARGISGRGRAFERVTKFNLIDVPLEEEADGTLELCRKFPEMDAERIGIYGWSFGGYFSAIASMRRPDVFKAAVAGAPVVDWRDYDTHYTERYMGLPQDNPRGYHDASVLTYCKDLSVPLMIIHGTADDNVYMFNSLRMTDALFRAGKKFEFVPLSGFTHSVPEPAATAALWSRIAGFFTEHLGGPR